MEKKTFFVFFFLCKLFFHPPFFPKKKLSLPPPSLFVSSFSFSKVGVQSKIEPSDDHETANEASHELARVAAVDPFPGSPPIPGVFSSSAAAGELGLASLARREVVDAFTHGARVRGEAPLRGRADGALEAVERLERGPFDLRNVDPTAVAAERGEKEGGGKRRLKRKKG